MPAYSDKTLRHAWLVQFNFQSRTMRVWNGLRNLNAGGQVWQPVGPNGMIDQIEDAISDSLPSVAMRISGVNPTLLNMALSEANAIRGRLAFVYDVFFDAEWQPGSIESYAVVRMDTLHVRKKQNRDGSWDQSIEITGEHFLTNGPCPPYGRYSNEDQWARLGNNDDKYFEYMGANQNRRQRWPTF